MPGCQTREENALEAMREAQELDAAKFDEQANAVERDIRALVAAARAVVDSDPGPACNSWKIADLRAAVNQFEPWLEQNEDPQSMGWVDGKGRP